MWAVERALYLMFVGVSRVPMMWAAAIHFFQVFLCRYVFLKRKEKGDLIHVRFRCVYIIMYNYVHVCVVRHSHVYIIMFL